MDLLPPLGTQIDQVTAPTHKIYGELLTHNFEAIKSTPVRSFSYGSHPRHQLDVYYPPSSSVSQDPNANNKDGTQYSNSSDSPVLVYIHGGGLYGGDKTLATIPNGLAHANVGHFFASKYGYTVVVPNYRLVFQDALFPSGGEDVSLVLDWVYANMQPPSLPQGEQRPTTRDLILMGQSAGGIHQSTYLFAPKFAAHRARTIYSSAPKSTATTTIPTVKSAQDPSTTNTTTNTLVLRAVVNLCVPVDIKSNGLFRIDVIDTYYPESSGSTPTHNPFNPLSLLQSAHPHEMQTLLSQVRFLILTAQYDPPEFVIDANRRFLDVLGGFARALISQGDEGNIDNDGGEGMRGHVRADTIIRHEVLAGHNHISPPVSLGTGLPREEEWGHTVGAFVTDVLRSG